MLNQTSIIVVVVVVAAVVVVVVVVVAKMCLVCSCISMSILLSHKSSWAWCAPEAFWPSSWGGSCQEMLWQSAAERYYCKNV